MSTNNAHTKHLCDISTRHGLHVGQNHQKANYEYTYVHVGANHDQILLIMCYPLYYMNV